jgi:hypothetical protein
VPGVPDDPAHPSDVSGTVRGRDSGMSTIPKQARRCGYSYGSRRGVTPQAWCCPLAAQARRGSMACAVGEWLHADLRSMGARVRLV